LTVGAAFPGRFGQPLHTLSDVPWMHRFVRLDETVALWRQLWRGEGPGSFHGEVLHFDELPTSTPTFRPNGPPIWLGGATPAALARTGRQYDGWLPYPPDPADYASGLTAIRAAATEAGRAPESIAPALFTTLLLADDVESGRATLDAYSRINYGVPLDVLETIQVLMAGPPEHLLEQLGRYTAAGAREIVFRVGALDVASQLGQLERIAEVVATRS
jgi:alkanesulfonate monooxygenase SsuD/methylene tetrahydromethanopterin reductase-like flavin-dependent oxidoreductase (luciferase family)